MVIIRASAASGRPILPIIINGFKFLLLMKYPIGKESKMTARNL